MTDSTESWDCNRHREVAKIANFFHEILFPNKNSRNSFKTIPTSMNESPSFQLINYSVAKVSDLTRLHENIVSFVPTQNEK